MFVYSWPKKATFDYANLIVLRNSRDQSAVERLTFSWSSGARWKLNFWFQILILDIQISHEFANFDFGFPFRPHAPCHDTFCFFRRFDFSHQTIWDSRSIPKIVYLEMKFRISFHFHFFVSSLLQFFFCFFSMPSRLWLEISNFQTRHRGLELLEHYKIL